MNALFLSVLLSAAFDAVRSSAAERGNALLQEGHYKEAAIEYRDAAQVATGADLAVVLNNLGAALAFQEENERAVPVLRRAHFLAEDSLPASVRSQIAANLARALIRCGDLAEASRLADVSIRLAEDSRSPHLAEALLLRVELQLAAGKVWNLAVDLERVRACADPDSESTAVTTRIAIHRLTGAMKLRQGHAKSAVANLRRAVELARSQPDWTSLRDNIRLLVEYEHALRSAGARRLARDISREIHLRKRSIP